MDLAETFREATRLMAQDDPPERPYDSQYAAAALLERVCGESSADADATAVAHATYALGMIALGTDDTPKGERLLEAFLAMPCVSAEAAAEALFLRQTIDALNHLGVLWSERGDLSKAEPLLRRAEALYEKHQHSAQQQQQQQQKDAQRPWLWDPACSVFATDCEALHTHTVFFLAQLFGLQKRKALSAEYATRTLRRQLAAQGAFDRAEWAKNCMGIAEWHAEQRQYRAAEQCLCKARAVLLAASSDDDAEQIAADIDWALARVLLEMFVAEAERSKAPGTPPPVDASPAEPIWGPEFPPTKTKALFPIANLEGAKAVFREVNTLLQRSLKFYVLDGYVTDHFKLLMDVCKLWATMSIFDPDVSRKCKMHKRRAKLLEPLVGLLNPQHFAWQLQHLHFRLGEVYADLSELKAEQLRRAGTISETVRNAAYSKINSAIAKSIKHYEAFLKACEKEAPGENEEAFISAQFALARLLGRRLGATPCEAVQALSQSLERYKLVVAHIERRTREGADMVSFQAEESMARQMVELLPQKIELVATRQNPLSV